MKIIKSFRKTITMKIDEAWELIVKAPFFMSKKMIEDFINKNKSWIEKRKEQVLERIKKYTENEKFLYFWDEYELKLTWKSKEIEFDGMYFYLDKKYKDKANILFANFYKKEARKYIEKRINDIAKQNNLKFNKLKITSAKTRWGSCTSQRNINFSYRLAMAPIKTIDYVIVHELAHLTEMNHSKKFWTLVEKMMAWLYPWDYKIHQNWLKVHWNKMIF